MKPKSLNTLHAIANSYMFRHEVCFMILCFNVFYLVHFVTECTEMHDMHKIKFSKHVLSLDESQKIGREDVH
jgi:hypothetical protein